MEPPTIQPLASQIRQVAFTQAAVDVQLQGANATVEPERVGITTRVQKLHRILTHASSAEDPQDALKRLILLLGNGHDELGLGRAPFEVELAPSWTIEAAAGDVVHALPAVDEELQATTRNKSKEVHVAICVQELDHVVAFVPSAQQRHHAQHHLLIAPWNGQHSNLRVCGLQMQRSTINATGDHVVEQPSSIDLQVNHAIDEPEDVCITVRVHKHNCILQLPGVAAWSWLIVLFAGHGRRAPPTTLKT
mmetsp:Transcript_96285/g.223246  ORF Transcript_96285/g.223246 Transcript_96285/m.223246 type:complete len:249 (-) Transcript_96285:7-753(-)